MPSFAHGLFGFFVNAEVDEIVSQMRPGQELRRQVAHNTHVLRPVVEDSLYPALDQAIAHGMRQGHVKIVDSGTIARPALHEKQVVEEGVSESIDPCSGSLALQRTLRVQADESRCGHFALLNSADHTSATAAMSQPYGRPRKTPLKNASKTSRPWCQFPIRSDVPFVRVWWVPTISGPVPPSSGGAG